MVTSLQKEPNFCAFSLNGDRRCIKKKVISMIINGKSKAGG